MVSAIKLRLAALSCCAFLAGCGGGAGGGGIGSGITGGVSPPPSPPPAAPVFLDYEIQAPLAPGNGGAAPLLATGTTPNFSTPPLAGTAFPLTITVMHIEGWLPDSKPIATPVATSGATLTVLDNSAAPTLRLQVPAMGIDLSGKDFSGSFHPNEIFEGASGDRVFVDFDRMTYALWGEWGYVPAGVPNDGSVVNNNLGVAVGGYQTPTGGMPVSGTAIYSQAGGVTGWHFIRSKWGYIAPYGLSGDVSLSADFSSGKLTGTLSNMVDVAGSPQSDVSLSGTISGATFDGATSAPAASGSFDGAFYGPAAEEAAGAWTLYNANGTGAIVGAFGAKKN